MQLRYRCSTTLRESGVTNRENLVEDQDLSARPGRRLHTRGARPSHSSSAEAPDCEALEIGKRENLVACADELPQREAHHGPEQFDVVDCIQIGVPANAEFENRSDRSVAPQPARDRARRCRRGFSAAYSSHCRSGPSGPGSRRVSARSSTSRSTWRRSLGCRRNRSSACSRTVSRRTDGIVNDFETPRDSMIGAITDTP